MPRPAISNLEFHQPKQGGPGFATFHGEGHLHIGRGGIFVFVLQDGNDWSFYQAIPDDAIEHLGDNRFRFVLHLEPGDLPPAEAKGIFTIYLFHLLDALLAPSTDFAQAGDAPVPVRFAKFQIDEQCNSTIFPPRCPPPSPDVFSA